MKRLFSLLFIALTIVIITSCGAAKAAQEAKNAEYEELKAAIAEGNFNMTLTQSVPTQGSYESYSDGRYIIRVRGGKAEVMLPNVSPSSFATFGGGSEATTAPVQMDARRVFDDKKGNHRFILSSKHGSNDYEIRLDVNDNGQGRVQVTRKPYYNTRYYATVEKPSYGAY